MASIQASQGRRLRALNDAFHRTTKYALRPVERAEFEAFFQGLGPEYVDVAYDGYLQALHQARVLAETDFQHVCEENKLRDKLYALEQLCEEQGITDGDEPAAQDKPLQCAQPSRAGPLCEAQQQEQEQLQEVLSKAKQELSELEAQLEGRRQQLRGVLQKARAIALSNEQVHAASKAWGSREVNVAS